MDIDLQGLSVDSWPTNVDTTVLRVVMESFPTVNHDLF